MRGCRGSRGSLRDTAYRLVHRLRGDAAGLRRAYGFLCVHLYASHFVDCKLQRVIGSIASMKDVNTVFVGWQVSGNVRNLARAYAMQGSMAYTLYIRH